MVKGLYSAYNGMIQEQRRMDVITNNLANSDTTGYKREATVNQSFEAQLALRIKDLSTPNTANAIGNVNLGVKTGETYRDYSQGNFKVTDNTYDLAIGGDGFFAIPYTDKAGNTSVKYTRDGAFTVNTDGYLVTKDGDFVLNAAGAESGTGGAGNYIKIDPLKDVSVAADGTITQDNAVTGKIGLVDFEDYNYLSMFGENLYDAVDGAVKKDPIATVSQGVLEASNVNIVSEMVEMIAITRAYEANQKIIQTIDETLDKAANTVGKV
ncbi:MAG: flagellar hook-basal body protein [Lachnospiraceae bacterium]